MVFSLRDEELQRRQSESEELRDIRKELSGLRWKVQSNRTESRFCQLGSAHGWARFLETGFTWYIDSSSEYLSSFFLIIHPKWWCDPSATATFPSLTLKVQLLPVFSVIQLCWVSCLVVIVLIWRTTAWKFNIRLTSASSKCWAFSHAATLCSQTDCLHILACLHTTTTNVG